MIISASAASTAKLCWQKAFNVYHRGISSTNYNLIDGGAMHAGVAHGLATKRWDEALEVAEAEFYKRVSEKETADVEYDMLAASHLALVHEMVKAYAKGFDDQNITVIQPEVKFKVPIGPAHNNIFQHWLAPEGHRWSEPSIREIIDHVPGSMRGPSAEDIVNKVIRNPHPTPDPDCDCWGPNWLVGTADAIVNWGGHLWLMEHKSTAIQGEQFWAGFRIDLQPTLYLLAIQKSLGLPLAGFILNAIRKPSEAQVSAWNAKRKHGPAKGAVDYIEYSREPFIRTKLQLQRQEEDLIELCREWEGRVLSGWFPLSNVRSICMQYNKACPFMTACVSDYGEEELIQLMQASIQKKLVVEDE